MYYSSSDTVVLSFGGANPSATSEKCHFFPTFTKLT